RLTSPGDPSSDNWSQARYRESVAAAVAAERPLYALTLRQTLLQEHLQPVGDGAYAHVLDQLREIRTLLDTLGRGQEFPPLVIGIRTEYKRRRNLMQMLDKLDEKPLLQRR